MTKKLQKVCMHEYSNLSLLRSRCLQYQWTARSSR